jgi:hypothetical protein
MKPATRTVVLAGALGGVLAVVAYVLLPGALETSALHSDNTVTTAQVPRDRSRTPAATPVAPDDNPASFAQSLQAVHDSLLRNDLASARVLLNAMLAIHENNPEALALRAQLDARESKAQATAPTQSAKQKAAPQAPSVALAKAEITGHTSSPERALDASHAHRAAARASARHSRRGEAKGTAVAGNLTSPANETFRAPANSGAPRSDSHAIAGSGTVSSTIRAAHVNAASSGTSQTPLVATNESGTTRQAPAGAIASTSAATPPVSAFPVNAATASSGAEASGRTDEAARQNGFSVDSQSFNERSKYGGAMR